jgi:hypothetical protein
MSLADSVYLGSGEARPTTQVVLTGTTGRDGATVRWAIRREPAPPEAGAVEATATTEPAAEAKSDARGAAADGGAEAPVSDAEREPAEGTDDGA